jgi:hypothetical protein
LRSDGSTSAEDEQAPAGLPAGTPARRTASGILWDKLCAMSDDRAVKALERRMNRPLAIALAALVVSIGVFFAGFMLIVYSTSKVTFPPELAVMTPTAGQTRVLPVSVDQGTSGTTATSVSAALKRGGEATIAAATPSGDVGHVGFKRTSSSSQTRAATTTAKSTTKAKPKTAKRAIPIGADSGP